MEATCTLFLCAYNIYTYPVRTWNLQAKFSYPVNRPARMIQLCTDHFNFHIPAIYILYVLKYNNIKKYRYRNKDTYPVTKVIITKQRRNVWMPLCNSALTETSDHHGFMAISITEAFFRSLLNLVCLHGLLNWWKIHIHTTPFQSADSWLDAFYWTNVQYKLQTTSIACLWAVATTITRAEQESYAMIWNLNHQTTIPSTRQGHQNLHGRLDEMRAVINSLTHIDAEARIELRTKGGRLPTMTERRE